MFCSFNSNDLYVWLRLTLNVQAPSSKSVAAWLLNHGVQSWSKSVGSVGAYHFNIIVRRIQLTNLAWGEYLHSGKMMQSKPYLMEDYNCMFQSSLIAKRTLTSILLLVLRIGKSRLKQWSKKTHKSKTTRTKQQDWQKIWKKNVD